MRILPLLLLAAAAFAGDAETLVDRLFDDDPKVRAEAREKLKQEGSLDTVLARIEARVAAREGALRFYDLSDFAGDDAWFAAAVARVRKAAGEEREVQVVRERGIVLVRAPKEVQERVEAALAPLRAAYGRLVQVEARFVRGAVPAKGLDVEALAAFLARDDVEIISAPRLVCRNGQRASVSVLQKVSYVADFEVTVEDGATIADPRVDTIHSGLVVNLRPVIRQGKVLVALESTVSTVEKNMPELPIAVPGGEEVKIQVPVGQTRADVRLVTCEPGVAVPVPLGGDRVLLVTARAFEAGCELAPAVVR